MSAAKGMDEKTISSEEKAYAVPIELPPDPDENLSPEEKAQVEKNLLRRLDWMLIPWLCLLYLICFLDRTNIGNAKIASLTEDISMTERQFSHTLTIFFVSYSAFEAVANVLLKRFRPSVFIPTIVILWGACMFGMGFVHNWSGLMAARWWLGVTEAGLFPGVSYYLSCWYRRQEIAFRIAIFFAAAAIAGSFGGLLAGAIQKLDGKGNLAGWAWIFILEGAITIIVGIASFWMVHDFPDEAKFLSDDDRARVIRRLKLDKQASAEPEVFKWKYVWQALSDYKTYVGMLIYMGPVMPVYSFSLFLPSIISNMGFTTTDNIIRNQLLTVPPYAGACVVTLLIGWWSDKTGRRGIFNMMCAPVSAAGFIMLMASTNPAVQYTGTFLGAMGLYPTIPITVAWIANNVEGSYKRGIVLGVVIGWGNLNGIVSSNIYYNAPRYFEGHGTVLGYLVFAVFIGSLTMYLLIARENKLRLQGKRDHRIEGLSNEQIAALGDRRPDFLYTL